MTQTPAFDGPRPIHDDEWRDSERLFKICFEEKPDDYEVPPEENAGKIEGPNAELQVISADGRVVSQIAIFWEQLKVYEGMVQIGSIGGVSTHPQYRGHRFALRLLQRCAERLREDGAEVMLISGGRGLYIRSGNVLTGRMAEFHLQEGQFQASSEGYTLRPALKSDVTACQQIYERQPVRFARTNEAYHGRFRGENTEFNAENVVIERDGQIDGYLFLHREWEDWKNPEAKRRGVWEAAGSPEALLAGADLLLRGRLTELRWQVPWQDQDLIAALKEAGQAEEVTALDGHTMRLLNFPAMRESLRPYIVARVGEAVYRELRFEQSGPLLRDSDTLIDEGRCAIVLGSDRLELDTMQMTLLVMGDPRRELADLALPGRLAEVIPAIFPLPTFLPGLNYH